MIHAGANEIDGVRVEVARRRCRRISVRVASDGTVRLTVPKWWATLREGEAFLKSKWDWVTKARARAMANRPPERPPISDAEIAALRVLLDALHAKWSALTGERGVSLKIRKVKSFWGCCHWRDRYVTYNSELARAPRELVEYVVVHEFSHFAVRDHGPAFRRLMDSRLPEWRDLRLRLNRRGR